MSLTAVVSGFARRLFGRAVAYGREFLLVAAYAGVCVAVVVPVLVATGAAIYWSVAALGLDGWLRTGYLAVGAAVVMFEFAMLYRFVEGLGRAMLGPTRPTRVR